MLASPVLKLRHFDKDSYSESAPSTAMPAPIAREATLRFNPTVVANDNPQTTEERLCSLYASSLWEFSKLAMHFEPEFRSRTLKQLRNLLDPDNWDEGDAFLDPRSFKSFARAMAFLRPQTRPMLGLSNSGNLLAMWSSVEGRLSFEHLPGDRLRWFITHGVGAEAESAAGSSAVLRLQELVAAHGMRALLDGEG